MAFNERDHYRVAVTGTSYQDDVSVPEVRAERIYNLAVTRLHSSYTVFKYRPDRTLEKSSTGTGSFRPRG